MSRIREDRLRAVASLLGRRIRALRKDLRLTQSANAYLCSDQAMQDLRDNLARVEGERDIEKQARDILAESCAKALDERDAMRAALEGVVIFFALPGEGDNARFERIGDAFYHDTMMLRPGKSEPLEACSSDRERLRQATWLKWVEDLRRAEEALDPQALTVAYMQGWHDRDDEVARLKAEKAEIVELKESLDA